MPSPGRPRRADREALYEAPAYRSLLAALGANLRANRLAKGLTSEQAAEKCGLRFAMYAEAEYARSNTTMLTLSRIAEGLGMSPWELLVPLNEQPIERDADGRFKRRDDSLPLLERDDDETLVERPKAKPTRRAAKKRTASR